MKIEGTINHILGELLKAALDTKKVFVCEVREKRNKRSLDANSYAWVLMDKIAKHPAVRSSKDEIYLRMLEKYGVVIYCSVSEPAIDSLRKTFRIVHPRGSVSEETDGIICVLRKCECYIGSSHYDMKEMSDFIEGIVSEARGLGIETETPDEVARLLAVWTPEDFVA